MKIWIYTNPYAYIKNFSTLCLYEIFEMANPMLLLAPMLQ